MAATKEADTRRAAAAIVLWARTVRTLRQHGTVARLAEDSLAQCRSELAKVVAERELVVELRGDEVLHDDRCVLRFDPTDVPFGRLADAGVGSITIARGTDEAQLGRLLRTCAAAPAVATADSDLARALRGADLPAVALRAPRGPQVGARQQRVDWWLLPEPQPSPELTGAVERELTVNRPIRALELLLGNAAIAAEVDLETALTVLLDAMLARHDGAGAAEFLQRTDQGHAVNDAVAARLRERAMQAFAGAWLRDGLATLDDHQGLVALAMQLGDTALDRLVGAANSHSVELPAWVVAMRGGPGS
ncbi:MAG: hypothetical protein NXI31_25990 [bacterium]|nr:hypothetical protein [bacterium]